jgi:hypothetical protein
MPAGLTQTERYLNGLSQRSFLSLWSFPNLFRKRSKELADLVVVCHNKVLIFSDKSVSFDDQIDLKLAWSRWYNRAVNKSVSQLRRAFNWIRTNPDRIYLDANATKPAQLFKRVQDPLEIHVIAVAHGAAQPCVDFFGSGSGSPIVDPHEDPKSPTPFHVGNPGGPDFFVHVFTEINLNIILQELDTVSDVCDYLGARQKFFQSGNLMQAASEEDLLAYYLMRTDPDGFHAFVQNDGQPFEEDQFVYISEGYYAGYRASDEYKRKKRADLRSYVWDTLIERFAKNFRDGTLLDVPEEFASDDGRQGGAEYSLRFMALVRRFERRIHAEAIRTAFLRLRDSGSDRFFRGMVPTKYSATETGFFIVLLKRSSVPKEFSFDQYRELRAKITYAYAVEFARRNRQFDRVVGLATEGEISGGRSEDLIYYEIGQWTEEDEEYADELSDVYQTFKTNQRPTHYHAEEYPETEAGLPKGFEPVPYTFYAPPVQPERSTGNRAQRRAEKARRRKNNRRR